MTLVEVLRHLLEYRFRLVAAAIGTIIGIGVASGTLALSATSSALVSERFDALRARHVTIRSHSTEFDRFGNSVSPFTPETLNVVGALDGVEAVGLASDFGDQPIELLPGEVRGSGRVERIPVIGATPHLADADECRLEGVSDLGPLLLPELRGALIGSGVTQRLPTGPPPRRVKLGGVNFTVVGTIVDCSVESALPRAIVINPAVAKSLFGAPTHNTALRLRVTPGAAQVIADGVAAVIHPTGPELVNVVTVPDGTRFRELIEADTSRVMLVASLISALIGLVTMASSSTVRVIEQRGDISLRRALGATGSRVVTEVIVESAAIGIAAGVLGGALGIASISAVAVASGWPLRIPPVTLASPLVGLLIGVIAGTLPALRALRIEPSDGLR